MKNFNYKNLFAITIFSKTKKRYGYIKLVYQNCIVCGNTRNPFWVKTYKCSKCGADKFEWHTRAWCGNMIASSEKLSPKGKKGLKAYLKKTGQL